MSRIAIQELAAGMRLAADVCDRSGRVLLRAGAVLGDAQIHAFKSWGVFEADIEGAAPAQPARMAAADPQQVAQVRAELAPFFRHAALEHPFMQALHEHLVERLIAAGGRHAP